MNLNCAILEDQPNSSRLLESMIHKLPDLKLLQVCQDVSSLSSVMKTSNPPHLLFLTLNEMTPALEGFLVGTGRELSLIIHSSNHAFAAKAFELNALAFLPDPLEFRAFEDAVDKAIQNHAFRQWQQRRNTRAETDEQADYFFVKSDYKIVKVNFNDILFIESLGEYVRIYTDAQKIVTLQSLSRLETVMPAGKFVRIHRSHIINAEKINFIQNNVVSIGSYQLAISKSYRKELMDFVNKSGLL